MSTFLPLLDYESLAELSRAGMAFEEKFIQGLPGILIQDGILKDVCSLLKAEVERSTEHHSTTVVTLRRESQAKLNELTVSFPQGEPVNALAWLREIASILLPVVRRSIEVHLMNHEMFSALPELSPDCLRIWVDAGGPSSVAHYLPYRVCDIHAMHDRSSFTSSLAGIVLCDESSNVELAEVFDPSGIFILIPIGKSSTWASEHLLLLTEILKKLAPLFRHSRKELGSKISQAAVPQDKQLTPEDLIETTSLQVSGSLKDLREELLKQRTEVARLRGLLTDGVRRLGALQVEEAKLIDLNREEIIRLATATANAIGKMPMVKSCMLHGSNLYLRTQGIYCFDHERRNLHYIGEFLVQVFLDAESVHYLWSARNLTKLGPLDHHGPHVGTSCNPCLGNTTSAFRIRAQAKDVLGIVSLIIQFLQSVNFADHEVWGPMIREGWPIVEESRWRKVEQVPENRIPAWQLPTTCIEFLKSQGEAWWEGDQQ